MVRSCDWCSIACRCHSFEVTGERSDERRHLPVALEPAEAASALRIPAAHQRLLSVPSRHHFTFARLAASRPPPDGEHVLKALVMLEDP